MKPSKAARRYVRFSAARAGVPNEYTGKRYSIYCEMLARAYDAGRRAGRSHTTVPGFCGNTSNTGGGAKGRKRIC